MVEFVGGVGDVLLCVFLFAESVGVEGGLFVVSERIGLEGVVVLL